MNKTKMSKKGAIVLPKAVRDAHGFEPGAEFEVIDGGKEITLRLVETERDVPKKKLTLQEFLAKRPVYDGPPITDEMIRETVLEEAKRRWDEKNSR